MALRDLQTLPPYSGQVSATLNSVDLLPDGKDHPCISLSRDVGYGGRRTFSFVEPVEDDHGSEEGDVEIYIWNERLATYVLLPEDEEVTDEFEEHIGAEYSCRSNFYHCILPDHYIPHNTHNSPVDHVLPLEHVLDEVLSPSSDFLPPIEQYPSPLSLNLSSLQPTVLPITLEEADCWQREQNGNYEFSASSVPSSPCSMVSGFTYTAPHAAWALPDEDGGLGLELHMEAQHIDDLSNAGYSRTFLEGLHDTSRRLTRGIDTATRKLLGRICKLVRSH